MKRETFVSEKPLLLGCGIFHKEISMLQEKNGWEMDTQFVCSSLHVNLDKLAKVLTSALQKNEERNCIVFYGECHPLMDKMIEEAHTLRTKGVNCIEMLLGKELFDKKLREGAFFLLENWALRWDRVITKTFGDNDEAIREVFKAGGRTYILAIITPTSGDFSKEAEHAAKRLHMPLRTMDVSLEKLEKVIEEVLERNGIEHNVSHE